MTISRTSIRIVSPVLSLLGAVLALGCGGSSSNETFYREVIRTECERFFDCAESDGDAGYDRADYNDVAGCVELEASVTTTGTLRRQLYIDEGTVVFDSGAAEACARVGGATCVRTDEARRACSSVYQGQLDEGESCRDDIECQSGNCTGDFFTCGSCAAEGTIGNPCRFFTCRSTLDEPAYCDDGVCVAGEDPNALTEDPGPGEDCVNGDCGPGLYCRGGVCANWGSEGDACDPAYDSCEPGTICGTSSDDPDRDECLPVRVETGAGEPCTDWDEDPVGEYVTCDASAGLRCRSGVCAVYSMDGEAGSFCGHHDDCASSLECRGNVCVDEPLAEGEPCNANGQCASLDCAFDLAAGDTICQPSETCS